MAKKYNPWKRGEPALIEVHSLKKHEVFRRYLSEYILRTNRFNKDVHLFRGSFEAHLDQIIKMTKTHNRTGRSIFLLDQYGYTDVTLFALQKIFSKLKNGNEIFQKTLKNVGFRFDTENLLEEKKHRNWRHEIQHKLIADLKNKAGARFYTNFFIKSEKSHMSYWLVHLSSHHRARDVMQEIHWNLRNAFAHYRKPGLFMLGYHPEKDYDLTNQTFLFSESDRELSHNALLDDIPRLLPIERMQVDQFLMSQINETPATLRMMKDAPKELHLYDEIIIKTPTVRNNNK